jgi:hypothetical protein
MVMALQKYCTQELREIHIIDTLEAFSDAVVVATQQGIIVRSFHLLFKHNTLISLSLFLCLLYSL